MWAVWLLAGCEALEERFAPTPTTLLHATPEAMRLDATPFPLDAAVLSRGQRRMAEVTVRYSVTPSDVGRVTDGAFVCTGSGDATVILTAGPLTAAVPVRCRLVDTVRVDAPVLTLVAGDPPRPAGTTVVDRAGRPLPDVPVRYHSDAPAVATVDAEGRVTALGTGVATITAEAGDRQGQVAVVVTERVVSEPVSLPDGTTLSWPLPAGRYLVDVVTVAADGSGAGVTLAVAGGSCPPQAEAPGHRVTCDVPQGAMVVLTNPTVFGLGPAAVGTVDIQRVPPGP